MPSGHECRQCVAPVQTSVAPVQRKNKYSCLVKRIRANGLKHQTAIKTKVVQIAVNATYTTFHSDYQRYYTQKCRVQTKCCKSLYGECTRGF